MRIPTSVIIMSLLTAAPFGLAIRDTLNKKAVTAEDEDPFESDYGRGASRARREALAEYEREAQREAEERSRKKAQQLEQLNDLFGPKPASMGSLLEGIYLGADPGSFQPEATRRRIDRASRDGFLSVSFDVNASALQGVSIEVTSRDYDRDLGEVVDACDTLRDKLTEAWGRPTAGSTWVDPAIHQRASIDPEVCVLTFDRYLDASEWVTAVPFDVIGTKPDKLIEKLGASVDYDDEGVYWTVPGLGLGKGGTKLEAILDKGRIVAVKAIANSDFDSVVAVREAITAKLKTPAKQDEDTGLWQWKKKASLDQLDSGRFVVTVGKIPWD